MTTTRAVRSWVDVLGELRSGADHVTWRAAAAQLAEDRRAGVPPATGRTVELTVLATHTTDFLAELLPVAGLAAGIDLDVRVAPFGSVETELLAPAADRPRPDHVLLSGTVEDLQLDAGPDAVDAAVLRWTGLWRRIREDLGARPVQCLFATPAEDVHGNASAWVPGSRTALVARINAELVALAGDDVLVVDCDRLAADVGRSRWRDQRYWDVLRQPVAMDAVPLLASTVAGVLAADVGTARRCVVVDLDQTLWRGVLGEDGISGVTVTDAHARFQQYLLDLRGRGTALAVASKNDPDLAAAALAAVTGMRLRPDDFAAVVADWRPKSEQVLDITERLNLGTASVVFVDDNPAECAQVASRLPDVDVVALPARPDGYVTTLAGRPTLEFGRPTEADLARAASYAALRRSEDLRVGADSLPDFLDSLRMRAAVRPVDTDGLARAAQLVQRTNQFNLTTRRHPRDRIGALAADPGWCCRTLALRDRFADHGVVGLLMVDLTGDVAEIDTLLLSCRVIGRDAERSLVAVAADAARSAGHRVLRGRYLPTERNSLVARTYPDLGFRVVDGAGGADAVFELSLTGGGPAPSPHIALDDRTRETTWPTTH